MKYFTFVDKDSFIYSRSKIWDTVLNVTAWPELWKHVTSVQIHTQGEISQHSKIDCYFTLFYILHLHFYIKISRLQKPSYASFEVGGDFSGQGRWILRENGNETSSTLHLHLRTHHFLLMFVSSLPYGKRLIQYSHKRVMLEGKKMIIKRLSGA
ncbi:MAG: hypothetical protein PF439_11770 [Helicobacteraceae bacterium]|jgi:hypothetical protein|nr:hypothetical protein [Helicobacteraceae bacterium]